MNIRIINSPSEGTIVFLKERISKVSFSQFDME